MFTSLSLASERIDLSEHGKDLTRAAFLLRYNFSKIYHKDWTQSTYADRKKFLTNWYSKLMLEEKKSKIVKKEEVRLALEKQKAKNEERKNERQRLKAQLREAKEEDKNFDQRESKLDILVRNQKRTIQRLKQKSSSSR